MDRQTLEDYCLSRHAATRDFPFGDDVAVYKVMGKLFALIPVGGPVSISLKCDPIRAGMLRATYPAVTAGYHLNKRLWNTIIPDGSIPDDEILELIDHSYAEVVAGLTKAQRKALDASNGEGLCPAEQPRPEAVDPGAAG